jgi:hypothetical protein
MSIINKITEKLKLLKEYNLDREEMFYRSSLITELININKKLEEIIKKQIPEENELLKRMYEFFDNNYEEFVDSEDRHIQCFYDEFGLLNIKVFYEWWYDNISVLFIHDPENNMYTMKHIHIRETRKTKVNPIDEKLFERKFTEEEVFSIYCRVMNLDMKWFENFNFETIVD